MISTSQLRKMLTSCLLCLCLALALNTPLEGQSLQTSSGAAGFCFHATGVSLPLGKFLLIRKGEDFGALRVTQITPDKKTKPIASEWLGSVAYESYFISNPSNSFSQPANGKRLGELTFARIRGFGFHYSWQSGNREAIVGPWKLHFFDRDGVLMTTVTFWNGSNSDSGLQFAPTNITEVNELDPREKDLHWYPYDRDRDIPCPVDAFSKQPQQIISRTQ